MEGENPCCVEWKNKCMKLEEGRNCLRKAVKLLDYQTAKLQKENADLKLEIKQEQEKFQLEKEGKEKELNTRQELEKEVSKLKAELTRLQNDIRVKSHAGADMQHSEGNHEADAEINRLKQLLDKEKRRGDAEKKKADAEKRKALEAGNLVKTERSRAEEERRIAEAEKSKAEELRVSLEKCKSEASEMREELIAERVKADEASRKADAERKKATKERKNVDMHKAKLEELQRLSQEDKKIIEELKLNVYELHKQLMAERLTKEGVLKAAEGNRDNVCHGDHTCTVNAGVDTEEIRALKGKLKLGKKRLRHARRVAKLHKLEKKFLKQELNFLKHDFFQLSRRNNMLDSQLCHKDEGIHDFAKGT